MDGDRRQWERDGVVGMGFMMGKRLCKGNGAVRKARDVKEWGGGTWLEGRRQ